jgi:hypothetical protein
MNHNDWILKLKKKKLHNTFVDRRILCSLTAYFNEEVKRNVDLEFYTSLASVSLKNRKVALQMLHKEFYFVLGI